MPTNGDNYGKVTQVIGATLDAEFDEARLPKIYNALKVIVKTELSGKAEERTLWCEVAQHLGGGCVRAVALGSTDGLTRGTDVLDTGQSISVPVGDCTLVAGQEAISPRGRGCGSHPAFCRAFLQKVYQDACNFRWSVAAMSHAR